MLPQSLQSSYARYKTDTNAVAACMLNRATECAYLVRGFPLTRSPVKQRRRKAKNIDELRLQIQLSILPMEDLQDLAGVVGSSNTPVPMRILDTTLRANNLRKSVSSWLLAQCQSPDNQGHALHATSSLGLRAITILLDIQGLEQ